MMSIAHMRRQLALPAVVLLLAGSLSACSGMNDTEQRILTGAAIGAGAGAGLGVVTGGLSIAGGAAIGAAAGAVSGLAVDVFKKND
ncbi:MAG TPA: hypothetical protein VND94_19300 [Terriglobia bacterium]|nr:hypothetical protein [Terriglobia bacterium]